MHDPSKLYIRKKYNWNEDFKDVNAVFIFIRKTDEVYIFKRVDTIFLTEEIVAIDNEEVEDKFYTFEEYLKTAKDVNKAGYYKDMTALEKQLYETFIVLSQNDYHVLIYDTISENIIVDITKYSLNDFICFEGKKKSKRMIRKGYRWYHEKVSK